jgi:hypothetical protein
MFANCLEGWWDRIDQVRLHAWKSVWHVQQTFFSCFYNSAITLCTAARTTVTRRIHDSCDEKEINQVLSQGSGGQTGSELFIWISIIYIYIYHISAFVWRCLKPVKPYFNNSAGFHAPISSTVPVCPGLDGLQRWSLSLGIVDKCWQGVHKCPTQQPFCRAIVSQTTKLWSHQGISC